MVDIWMIMMMLYPFLTVSLFTVKELLKNSKNVNKNSGSWVEQGDRKVGIVSHLLNIVLPLVMGISILIYWTVGLCNYVSPDVPSACT